MNTRYPAADLASTRATYVPTQIKVLAALLASVALVILGGSL